jgi:hypothetical protein
MITALLKFAYLGESSTPIAKVQRAVPVPAMSTCDTECYLQELDFSW